LTFHDKRPAGRITSAFQLFDRMGYKSFVVELRTFVVLTKQLGAGERYEGRAVVLIAAFISDAQ
jgi:hypothetical protein